MFYPSNNFTRTLANETFPDKLELTDSTLIFKKANLINKKKIKAGHQLLSFQFQKYLKDSLKARS